MNYEFNYAVRWNKSIFHHFERAFIETSKTIFFERWEPDFNYSNKVVSFLKKKQSSKSLRSFSKERREQDVYVFLNTGFICRDFDLKFSRNYAYLTAVEDAFRVLLWRLLIFSYVSEAVSLLCLKISVWS